MPKFLSTTGVSYELEELIKGASERLILISPFLRVNQRIRELLADKDRLKIDTRVVYGKSELSPEQSEWLLSTPSIRTSYCANLHAKCYLSESLALLTSMNLYEFSQVNNIEMGVLISRNEDPALYGAVYQEVLTILRSSEEHTLTNRTAGAAALRGDAAAEQPVRRKRGSEARPVPSVGARFRS